MKSGVGAPGRSIDLLLVAWCLFAFWALATYGMRFGFLLYVELGLDRQTDIVNRDFINYWVGGQFALDGRHMILFDQPQYFAYLQSLFGPNYPIHAWSYPPHFLMLVAPLGLLEYRMALVVFLLATFALFVLAALAFRRRLAPETPHLHLWLALFGYVLMQVETTQNGFLTSALLLGVFAYMRERPAVAGLALALLTVKPQLGFLIPLLALIDRNWALLRWATVFTVVLVGLSVALFGVDSWRAYFTEVVPYQQFVMNRWSGSFLPMMPSTFGSIRTLEFAPELAHLAQWIVSGAAFACLLRLLFVLKDPLERMLAIVAGTFLISPYSFHYDMGAMSIIAACLALRARANGRNLEASVYGVLAVLPAAIFALGNKGLPIAPLVLAAGFAVLWLGARRPLSAPVSG